MFRLLGFDVHVRTGFVLFTGLIVFLYQDAFGLWLAGSIAVLTLLHELGHAVAARRAGAHAEISLDFLAGYTSFRPSRPMSRLQRAGISIAGPATQIVISVAILLAMGVNPLSWDSAQQSDAAAAIWWAGPAIGALNLIPVLPLDGGHLAMTGLEKFVGDRSLRVMAVASVAVTGAAAVLMFVSGRSGFVIFIAFLLFNQLQILQATSKKPTEELRRSRDVETIAWQEGRPGVLEPGQRLSPWFEAHRARLQGDVGGAMGIMLADFRSAKPGRWMPPYAATPDQLRAVIDTLPADLPPAGNEYSARVLAEVLLALGDKERGGQVAAEAYASFRSSTLATIVARAAAATGDTPNALRWLEAATTAAAAESTAHQQLLVQTLDAAPELVGLRASEPYAAIRDSLR